MKHETSRRGFVKTVCLGLAGTIPFLSGCIAPRISPKAYQKEEGTPWRCDNCGHLTRSNDDLSDHRCPRCYAKKLKRITEEKFAEFMKKYKAAE